MPTKTHARNVSVELLRIVAMFLILACHFIIHFDWDSHHFRLVLQQEPGWRSAFRFLIVQYGQVGVSIFFIISGYFLVEKSFKWSRLVKTWLQMFCYSVIFLIIVLLLGSFRHYPMAVEPVMHGPDLYRSILASIFPFFYNSYWFIGAYLLMLLVAPYLNALFNTLPRRSMEMLIVLLGFFSVQILIFGRASNWNNLVYAMLGYLIGGWLRKYYQDYADRFKTIPMIGIIVLLTALMVAFNHYISEPSWLVEFMGWKTRIHDGIVPFPIIIGTLVFIMVSRIDMNQSSAMVQRVICTIAPTTFGIYLIHENWFGFRIVWDLLSRMAVKPAGIVAQVLAQLGVVVALFVLLSAIAWMFDTLIVHPLVNMLRSYSQWYQLF